MSTITVSRQYASGGEEIAARAAQLLGYTIFDKTMMAAVAAELGLNEHEIVDFRETDQRSLGFIDRLLGHKLTVAHVRTWQEDLRGVRTPTITKISDDQAIALVRGVIDAAYKRDNVLIVGRGGQAILRGQPNVLHVRIEAPLEHRVQRLMERGDYTPTQAELEIEDHDRAARDYVRRYYDLDPTDSTHYHLLINTGLLDLETAAQVIALAAQQMQPVPQPEVEVPMAMPFFYP
ncbi:MAG: cytidylate kinase-like family protein [Anaerolineae bacterium]